MPISPCPSVKNALKFVGQRNPHVDQIWNKSITGPTPQWMQKLVSAAGVVIGVVIGGVVGVIVMTVVFVFVVAF